MKDNFDMPLTKQAKAKLNPEESKFTNSKSLAIHEQEKYILFFPEF